MEITLEHNKGEDFGTVRVTLGPDDTARAYLDGDGGSFVEFALYNHEAAALMDQLQPLADEPEM